MTSEEYNLKLSWDCYPAEYLDHYLVSGVEDPRINGQSILTRALLIDALYPGRFDALITEELRFGAVLTWILQQLEKGSTRQRLLDAIESPNPAYVPEFILKAAAWLREEACPVPDYIAAALCCHDGDQPRYYLSDLASDTFLTIWSEQLSQAPGARMSILEVACGSANDYRFLHESGLARLLNYTGIDIAAKNIANAKRRFPDVDFRVQSILTTGFPDSSYDCVFCHDLLEHLSLAAMKHALGEMLRIAGNEVVLHFFNAKWSGDHDVVPVRSYYRNRVSMEKVSAFFEGRGATVICLEMAQWFQEKVGASGYHNPNAFSMIVEKQAGLAK
jgi:ubiquinone/menaquinone biosynthesis C-methylase UbiE